MTGATLIAFIGLLVALLLLVTALVVWQEAKKRPSYDPLEYVIDDAVQHIQQGLAAEGKTHLSKSDIRRIVEWEVFYLQGLAQERRSTPVETVAGGHDASVEYIVAEIQEKHGIEYSPEDVADVLRYEADYLIAIGAVGEPVDPDGGDEK